MSFVGKIAALFFACIAYVVLRLVGWKRGTVLANAKHVAGAVSLDAGLSGTLNYDTLLWNLTRHASELLFCKMRAGGIFLTAHYGNYEAMGPWLCRLGIPLVASYIPVKPKWLNNILERKIRAVDGRSYSVDARTPRDFLRILNDGKLFCLLSDQDSRIPSALPGTFLGRPVNINPLPDFLLKHRPKTPVFICWMEEVCDVRVLHAIEVERVQDPSSAPSLQLSVVNTQFNKWLEQRIHENPNLWYGFTHRRFYSQSTTIYK